MVKSLKQICIYKLTFLKIGTKIIEYFFELPLYFLFETTFWYGQWQKISFSDKIHLLKMSQQIILWYKIAKTISLRK